MNKNDMKKNIYATTYVETALLNMVGDKIDNMTGSEISEKLADFISGNEKKIAQMAYYLIENDEIVNDDTNIRAASDLDIDALTKECEDDNPEELLFDALYNYDALWMTAIQRCFPDSTTDNQCGWGTIRLVKPIEKSFSSIEEAKDWGAQNLDEHEFVKAKIGNEDKSEVVFLCGTDKAYEEELWSDLYEILEKHLGYFDGDIDDDDDSKIVDQSSELRDVVIEWIEEATGNRFVDVSDEY